MPFTFVQNDTGSKIEVTCKDDAAGTAINLIGATVRLRYKIAGGALQTKIMTITNAVGGKAEYQFAAGELGLGEFSGEVEITDSTGKILTSLSTIHFSIRGKLS